jgi:site-specific recombinase XerD
MPSTPSSLTHRRGKGFTRDLGYKLNAAGKKIQPRFLLGHDATAARLANAKLEALWEIVVREAREHDEDRLRLPFGPRQPVEPLWNDFTLQIADAVRRGQPTVSLPKPPSDDLVAAGPHDDASYATWLHRLQQVYGAIIAFVPDDAEALKRGREEHRHAAEHRARQARVNAAIAQVSLPETGTGATLYQALDEYCRWVLLNKQRDGKATPWAKTLEATARRLKTSSPDMPLAAFNFAAVETMTRYWASRPPAKTHAAQQHAVPISIETVRGQMKALRAFCRWLARRPEFVWRLPDFFEDACRINYSTIQTADEVSRLGRAIPTFSIDTLAILYQHATPREQALILVALNCGFAQAEIISLRHNEVDLLSECPTIKHVRYKTRVYGEWKLWPQTVDALHKFREDLGAHKQPDAGFLFVNEDHRPYTTSRIANIWTGLFARAGKQHAVLDRLSFRYLRKTAGQLIRNVSDGETAGIFLCHGNPVPSDDLLDVYTNRDFAKVHAALDRVHELLRPMFRQNES